MREMALLHRVCDAYRAILGDRLTGFYVHGSIAFGCFTWETGDIDFLCVVDQPLTQLQKEALIRVLLELAEDAPPKGFEMSVVQQSACRPFRYPTPFELHYSNAHSARAGADLAAYSRDMHGTDPDLAAHVTVLHHAGIALYGPPIAEVFGEVPRASYLDSILSDVADAPQDDADPVYFTLNLCRVLAYLTEGAVLSKQQGGQWGLANLPQAHHPLLQRALTAYQGGADRPDPAQARAFAAMMLHRIHSLT